VGGRFRITENLYKKERFPRRGSRGGSPGRGHSRGVPRGGGSPPTRMPKGDPARVVHQGRFPKRGPPSEVLKGVPNCGPPIVASEGDPPREVQQGSPQVVPEVGPRRRSPEWCPSNCPPRGPKRVYQVCSLPSGLAMGARQVGSPKGVTHGAPYVGPPNGAT
jgi:hypothetical protein